MNARPQLTRREELLAILRHGGASTDEIAELVTRNALTEALADQAAIHDAELSVQSGDLRRRIQHEKDGKARWRKRAEEAEARVAELTDYERLSPQQCPKGLHADWLVDSEYAHTCPWCRIAELEGAAVCPSVARLYGSKCVLPVRHRGDHRDETKRHYWSDEYAIPQQRSEAP